MNVADAIFDVADRVIVADTHRAIHRDTLHVISDIIHLRVATIAVIVALTIRETTPPKVVLRVVYRVESIVDHKVTLLPVLLRTVLQVLGINYLMRTIK